MCMPTLYDNNMKDVSALFCSVNPLIVSYML